MSKELWWKALSLSSICGSLIGLLAIRQHLQKNDEVARQMRELPPSDNLPLVAVLVPARNEQANIVACLTAILEQDYPNFEVIVIDDNSNDATPQLLAELSRLYPARLQILQAPPPANGWLGKNNALWQGYQRSDPKAEWLLFVDADTRLLPGALRQAVNYAQTRQLDLLSLIPAMRFRGFWSGVATPEIGKLYSFATSNPLHPPKPGSVAEASAVGPFILTRRSAYAASGGHGAVRSSVIEDVDLARNFRAHGYSTLLSLGFDYVEQEWYKTLPALWEGVSKNLFLVSGKDWRAVTVILLMQAFYGLLPVGMLLASLLKFRRNRYTGQAWLLSILAVGLTVHLHGETYHSLRLPRHYAVFYPLAVLISALVMLNSAVQISLFRSVSWKGRQINT